MTEWEKLVNGQMYNDFDSDLFQKRVEAKQLFRVYNKTDDSETAERNDILSKLFKSLGKDVWIEPDFRCEYGRNISIGNSVYVNFGCIILDCAEVIIGDDVLIGPNVGIYPVNHAIDPEERVRGGCLSKPVHIGKRVWIGGDVKILAGVTISDDAIIGTVSIVTKDIPSGVIAVGNPCRIIRVITEKDKTDYLNQK